MDHRTGELYQISLISSLAGVYEVEIIYGEIRQYGDLGLLTFNDLDGEMIAFERCLSASIGRVCPSRH